jgi:hypothetical protein
MAPFFPIPVPTLPGPIPVPVPTLPGPIPVPTLPGIFCKENYLVPIVSYAIESRSILSCGIDIVTKI